jgi:hypothetical protein
MVRRRRDFYLAFASRFAKTEGFSHPPGAFPVVTTWNIQVYSRLRPVTVGLFVRCSVEGGDRAVGEIALVFTSIASVIFITCAWVAIRCLGGLTISGIEM